jgi:hypothetical protein
MRRQQLSPLPMASVETPPPSMHQQTSVKSVATNPATAVADVRNRRSHRQRQDDNQRQQTDCNLHHHHHHHHCKRDKGVTVVNKICCDASRPPVLENRTAFVDLRYGSDEVGASRLDDPARPFRSITAAVAAVEAAIAAAGPGATPPAWAIRVSPGDYVEDVSLPDGVALSGSGTASTFVSSVRISGNNELSALALKPRTLPALSGVFASADTNGVAKVTDVGILIPEGAALRSDGDAEQVRALIELTQTEGINAEVFFDSVWADASLVSLGAGYNALAHVSGMRATFVDFGAWVRSPPEAETVGFLASGATAIVHGGATHISVGPRFPVRDIAVFAAEAGGSVSAQGHVAEVLLTVLQAEAAAERGAKAGAGGDPYPYDDSDPSAAPPAVSIAYARAGGASDVTATGSTILFQTVPLGVGLSALVEDASSTVSLLDVSSPGAFFPAVQADSAESVRYRATSGGGNVVASGGLYTNVVRVDGGEQGGERFVQDDDSLILVAGEPLRVLLPDPAEVSPQVIYRGKIVSVKNVTPDAATATVEGKIFDAPSGVVEVGAGGVVTLQAGEAEWYVLSTFPPVTLA